MNWPDNQSGIFYFLGNIPSHIAHALPLYNKIGGTFVVTSKQAQETLQIYDVPVVCIDDVPDLFLEFDMRIRNTVRMLNKEARVVLFYELFAFPKLATLTKPKKIFLTHGNMLKSYMTANPHRLKIFRSYDYMASLGPYLRRQFIEADGIPPQKLIDVGIARTDEVIKHKGSVFGYRSLAKELGLDDSKPLISYMPTFWGASSVYHIGKELVRNLPDEYNLVFRPHPQTPAPVIAEYEFIIKDKPTVRFVADGMSRNIDMLTLLNASSAIVGDVSSVMLEAILADKPLLFAEVTGREEIEAQDLSSISELVDYSTKLNIDNIHDIKNILSNTLVRGIDQSIWRTIKERVFFHYDGTSVKSIAEFVSSLK